MLDESELEYIPWIRITENNCVYDPMAFSAMRSVLARGVRAIVLCCYMQSWRYFLTDPNSALSNKQISRVRVNGSYEYEKSFANYSLWARREIWRQFRAAPDKYAMAAYTIDEIRARAKVHFYKPISASLMVTNSTTNSQKTISSTPKDPNIQLIGVHIRLTDYQTRQGAVVAGKEYFLVAAEYFLERFHNVRK